MNVCANYDLNTPPCKMWWSFKIYVNWLLRIYIKMLFEKNMVTKDRAQEKRWLICTFQPWYVLYEVCPDNFRKITIKKTVIVTTFCIFSFCQYGCQRSSRTSGSSLFTAGALWQSLLLGYFSYPHLTASRRPPELEWGWQARSWPPGRLSNSKNVVADCQSIVAAIASAASHDLNCSFLFSEEICFFTHLADFFQSFAVLIRVA